MTLIESIILWAYTGLELAGVAVILVGAAVASFEFIRGVGNGTPAEPRYQGFRRDLGRAILIGLEFLVAADIIRTIAIDTTIASVASLGLIVLMRTFLGLTLGVEIEGRWPWQGKE